MESVRRGLARAPALAIGGTLSLALLVASLVDGDDRDAGSVAKLRAAGAVGLVLSGWLQPGVVPLGLASLLPIPLFPLLGVLDASDVSACYFHDTIVLFFGTLLLADAVETCGLHRRTALLLIVRAQGWGRRGLLWSFMAATAFVSAWLSNTAAAALMLPVAKAVLSQLDGPSHGGGEEQREPGANSPQGCHSGVGYAAGEAAAGVGGEEQIETEEEGGAEGAAAVDGFGGALVLGVAYASSLGGMATLTGTGPNVTFAGQFRTLFPDDPSAEVSFAAWIVLGVPLALAAVAVTWAILCAVFRVGHGGRGGASPEGAGAELEAARAELVALGPVSAAERRTAMLFCVLMLLWLTRPWFLEAVLPNPGYVSDASVAMAVALCLFVVPSGVTAEGVAGQAGGSEGEEAEILLHAASHGEGAPRVLPSAPTDALPHFSALLDIRASMAKLPWDILHLLGAGFGLSLALQQSGLADSMAAWLEGIAGEMPRGMFVTLCCVVVVANSNWMSNTATAAIFVPLAACLAARLDAHPLALAVPVTLSCSLSFVLPAATPPNSLAFGTGSVSLGMMAYAGVLTSLADLALVLATCWLWAPIALAFDATGAPQWASAGCSIT